MAITTRLASFWRNLVHRDRVERDLDAEIGSTYDLLVDENLRAGMPSAEARRAAALSLGGIEASKDRVRDARAGAFVESVGQDIQYAARLLRRSPIFTATAALSLAIGIGANTTIFSVANALLLRSPSGVSEPGRLVDIGVGANGQGFNASYPDYLDVRDRATALEQVYATQLMVTRLTLGNPNAEGPETMLGSFVSWNYLTALGVHPVVGRFFSEADAHGPISVGPSFRLRQGFGGLAEARSAEAVSSGDSAQIVLSHAFWSRRFGADPSVVGRSISLNGQPFTIVGVAEAGFHGTRFVTTDGWLPVTAALQTRAHEASILTNRASAWLVVGARLKAGVTRTQAAAELGTIARALALEHPAEDRGRTLNVFALSALPGGSGVIAAFLGLLMGLVTLVLLVACANVAGILLARATARRREIAMRLALGAGRTRLIRQLLTETLLLFAVAGAAGVMLARGLTSLLVSFLPALPFPIDLSLPLDGRVVLFTASISFAAALVAGLVPAFQASRSDVVSVVKDESLASTGRSRLRHAFIVAQVAFSVLVVVIAGLFARALQQAALDPGFDSRGVELTTIDLPRAGYSDRTAPLFTKDLLARLRRLPAVESATIAAALPGGFERIGTGLRVPGVVPPDGQPMFEASLHAVEPGYFATLRIPLVAGRDFQEADSPSAPLVAIVTQSMARRFWPGESPIGRFVEQPLPGSTWVAPRTRPLRVVGVAGDIKSTSLIDGTADLVLYVPVQQQYGRSTPSLTIVARGRDNWIVRAAVTALVRTLDPNLPIVSTQTLEEAVSLGLIPQRVAAAVSSSLGLVGLLLAGIGIYGVTAYAVARRTREIGIRLALGARRSDVIRMVIRQALVITVLGCAIGLTLAAGAAQVVSAFLFGAAPNDPLVFGGAVLLFAGAALTALIVPVRRATRINPLEALRCD